MSTFDPFRTTIFILSLLAFALPVNAEPPVVDYCREVRPILAEHCFACHGTDEASREAGLRLDLRDEAIQAAAIQPGDADASEMISRLHSDDPDAVMPPPRANKPLSENEKQTLARWIDQGADYQPHWSFVAPVKVDPPIVNDPDWQRNPIDAFVRSRLSAAGLQPNGVADPARLFRRLHFDITGLPPSPDDAANFADQFAVDRDAAIAQWVDQLMDRPQWGEHRARYWLDAARYADTHGMHSDNYREIWPYRDWVIRALNKNQPLDQFYVDQLAGDLLENPTVDQKVATGFLRCNMTTNEGGTIDEENLAVYAADRVQTFGWVFLGLTTNCAQCHDHKFDPFGARDYYALSAFFRNMETPAKDGNHPTGAGPTMRVPTDEDSQQIAKLESMINGLSGDAERSLAVARQSYDPWRQNITPRRVDSPSNLGAPSLITTPALSVPLNIGFEPSMEGQWSDQASLVPYGSAKFVPIAGPNHSRRSVAEFDGESSLEVLDIPPQRFDEPMSLSLWIQPISNYGKQTIVSRLDPARDRLGWEINIHRQRLHFVLSNSYDHSTIEVRCQDDLMNRHQWRFVSFTYDGSGSAGGVSMYGDGEPVAIEVISDNLAISKSNDGQLHDGQLHDGHLSVGQTGVRQPSVIDNPIRIGNREGNAGFKGQLHGVRLDTVVQKPWAIARLSKLPGVIEALAANTSTNEAVIHSDSLDDDKNDDLKRAENEDLIREFYGYFVEPQASAIQAELASLRSKRMTLVSRSPITHVAKELGQDATASIMLRGEYDNLGDKVFASTPAALHAFPADSPRNRLGLARWVVDPANPLTARVSVNRFWQEIFGLGIVSTPEDFGVTGAVASHPELLDYLAADFVQNGWDVKRFFRNIFTSRTYQQSAVTNSAKLIRDPENSLLSRGPRFRMDAEMIRDNALATSGLLSKTMYGPGVKPYQPIAIWSVVGLPEGDTRDYVVDKNENLYRRTIYNFWKRMAPSPNMETFGAPNRETCVVRRERTNTPLQALVTLNDAQFVEAARVLASEMLSGFPSNDQPAQADAIDWIGGRLLTRNFSAGEQTIIIDSLNEYLDYYRSHPDAAQSLIEVGQTSVDPLIDSASLAAWTMVCNQLMNLDEVLCK